MINDHSRDALVRRLVTDLESNTHFLSLVRSKVDDRRLVDLIDGMVDINQAVINSALYQLGVNSNGEE